MNTTTPEFLISNVRPVIRNRGGPAWSFIFTVQVGDCFVHFPRNTIETSFDGGYFVRTSRVPPTYYDRSWNNAVDLPAHWLPALRDAALAALAEKAAGQPE